MRVPPADPTKKRRRKWLLEPIAISRPGRWYVINVAPKIDNLSFRFTGGRVKSVPTVPMVFLTHTGAKSGRQRVTPLLYFSDGDDVILMASNYGRERHPAWFYNVKANPDVELCANGRRGRYRASIAEGGDRDRLWSLAKRFTRAYANYEERATERTIQVVRCTPLDPA